MLLNNKMDRLKAQILFGLNILVLVYATDSKAQLDTAFWFAAPEVSISNQNFDRPIILRFTSSALPAIVTVSQPANASFTPINLNLAAYSTGFIDLTTWIDIIENKPPNQVLNYGLKITATNPVSAYYEVVSAQCLCNPEIFALKGRNAVGLDFYIPMQNFLNNSSAYTPMPYSSFDIIATENNTQVAVFPTSNLVGHVANTPFIISLNQGQTYSATATSQLASMHPGGTRVMANKPVAITVKDDLLHGLPYGGCADLAGDQIIPISVVGDEYIVVRGFLNAPYDKVFIMATQNSTAVQINGVLTTTLNAGQTYQYSIGAANAAYITSSAPVYVWHMSGFGCEVGLSILPPIECTGSSNVAFTRSSSDALHITLLVPLGGESNFLMNGIAGMINAASFTAVPSTGGLWKYAQISFTTAQIPVGSAARISNTSHLFHLGIIHGSAAGGCRFGYFSDYAKYRFEITANTDTLCAGDSLSLTLNNIPGSSPQWNGPSGFVSTSQSVAINPVAGSNHGYYHVSGMLNSCPIEPDSIFIQVHPLPQPQITTIPTPPVLCTGDTISLTAHGGINYSWSGGLGAGATHVVTPTLSTTYSVNVTDSNGCQADTSITITVNPLPTIGFQPSAPQLCDGDTIQITATGAASYLWAGGFGPGGSISINPSSTTVYAVHGTDTNGCIGVDSLVVTVHPDPVITLNPSAQQICLGDTVTILAAGAQNYVWNPGSITANPLVVSPLQTTTYAVYAVDAYGCTGSDSLSITVLPLPLITILPPLDSICEGESTILDVVSDIPGTLFSWSTGQTGTPISLSPSASVNVTVTGNANGCTGTQQASIVVLPDPTVFLGEDDYICPRESILLKPTGTFSQLIWWDGSTGIEQLITQPGIYWVKAMAGQCFAEDTVTFFECPALFIPNAFTPDGDGKNDLFFPVSFALELLQLEIYDRFGKIIYSTTDPSAGWDGTDQGQPCPDGVYVYLIRYYNPEINATREQGGTVHLIR
jgi:gliding motility-associated-like protein